MIRNEERILVTGTRLAAFCGEVWIAGSDRSRFKFDGGDFLPVATQTVEEAREWTGVHTLAEVSESESATLGIVPGVVALLYDLWSGAPMGEAVFLPHDWASPEDQSVFRVAPAGARPGLPTVARIGLAHERGAWKRSVKRRSVRHERRAAIAAL